MMKKLGLIAVAIVTGFPADLSSQVLPVDELVNQWVQESETPPHYSSEKEANLWAYVNQPGFSPAADSAFNALLPVALNENLRLQTRGYASAMLGTSEGKRPGTRTAALGRALRGLAPGDRAFVALAGALLSDGSTQMKAQASSLTRQAIRAGAFDAEVDVLLLLDALVGGGAPGRQALRGLVEGGEVQGARAREVAVRALARAGGSRP
jgi:hypothetical protein